MNMCVVEHMWFPMGLMCSMVMYSGLCVLPYSCVLLKMCFNLFVENGYVAPNVESCSFVEQVFC